MKRLLLIYVSMFITFSACAQNVALKLFIEDNAGRKDTIIFGVNDTSTLGVDTVWGEINIFGAPHDSLDVRIIQRDSANFNCIREYNYLSPPTANLYFPDNIDSKIDFRPFGEFKSVYNSFEIYISAVSYPLTILADFSEIQNSYLEGYSSIHLLDSSCNATETKPIYYNSAKDSLFILPDSTYNTLVAHFEHEVSVNEKKREDSFILYPNPFHDEIALEGINSIENIKIISLRGEQVYEKQIKSTGPDISLSFLPPGCYFIVITDSKSQKHYKKIIKM